MDEQITRIFQQLKSNPAALQALMGSPDGQALLHRLSGEDQACWQAASRQITQNIQAFLQRSLLG